MWDPNGGLPISGGLFLILGSAAVGSLAAVMMKQMEGVRPLRFQAWIGLASVLPLTFLTASLEANQIPQAMEAGWAFLAALLEPQDPRSDAAAVSRSRFVLALRGLYEYAADGGDLADAVTANETLGLMMNAWHGIHGDGLTLADAVEAAWLLEHMLRPLAARPIAADIVHSSMNGLSMLVAMATKWRYGIPVVMSEHGIYLRERYLSYLQGNAPHAVKVLVLSFFRALAGGGYLMADALAPHSDYNRRWQLQNGADPGRMWTMYNGVSLDEFPLAESEPAEPTVVFMGRVDPLKDLQPVSLIAVSPLVLAAPAGAPVGKAFFDQAKAQGDKLNYGTPGVGTVAHLGMELLKAKAGIAPVHVPYPGNPQVINAMIGGQIHLSLLPPGLAAAQIRAGKLKRSASRPAAAARWCRSTRAWTSRALRAASSSKSERPRRARRRCRSPS